MKLNHRQRIAFRQCLRHSCYLTAEMRRQQRNNNGVAHPLTTQHRNKWAYRAMRYARWAYIKKHV